MPAADGSAQADAARAKLEKLRDVLNDEVRRLLLALDTQRGESGLLSDRQALANAARVRTQVIAAIEQRAPLVVDAIEDATAKAADAVARSVKLGDFPADAVRTLEEIVDGRSDDALQAFTVGKERIGEAMRAGITTGAPLGELIDEVARDIRTTFTRAQTAVDTACIGAGRLVTIRAGDEGDTDAEDPIVYRYVGPDDAKARDFCSEIVGKCFTRAAMARLDNGLGMDVSVYGGGWSCRHSWAPMLLSEASSAGYEVVP